MGEFVIGTLEVIVGVAITMWGQRKMEERRRRTRALSSGKDFEEYGKTKFGRFSHEKKLSLKSPRATKEEDDDDATE